MYTRIVYKEPIFMYFTDRVVSGIHDEIAT